MNEKIRTRGILLAAYESASMALERPMSNNQVYFIGGKLRAIAEILQECRHTGDGFPVIKPDQWIDQADKQIAESLRKLQERSAKEKAEVKNPAPKAVDPAPEALKRVQEAARKFIDPSPDNQLL